MDGKAQRRAAQERYRLTADDRKSIARRRQEHGTWATDTAEQVELRVRRLLGSGQLPYEAVKAAAGSEKDPRVVLERIIDATNDLQPVAFLSKGARTVRTVAHIEVRGGHATAHGTGFLVSPRLLLTNNHVLTDPATAEHAVAQFNFEVGEDDRPAEVATYQLDPDTLFLTDEALDYTLVAVRPDDLGRVAGATFGWNALVERQGKAVIGDSINVVGHPLGQPKQIAIRNGSLANQLDRFLHYTTDTEPGSSGSPVFNDQWEVVALHHASIHNPDAADGDFSARGAKRPDAFVNEGARISVLLGHLKQQTVRDAQRVLLRELLQPTALPATNGHGDLERTLLRPGARETRGLDSGVVHLNTTAPGPPRPPASADGDIVWVRGFIPVALPRTA